MLLSVNVGLPKDVAWQGKTVYTGVWKHPVAGPAMVRRLNIDGDGQGDTAGHGGEQRAVLVYQIQSYRHWQQHFGRDDFSYGQFGENLTVDGLPDDEVCIGDRYRIGEAEFEVTQPRVTCYRVGLRLGEPELPALLVSHHRPGFYMRVITEGHIQAGDPIVKTRTGPGALSVADTDALLYLPGRDPAKLRAAAADPGAEPRLAGLVPRPARRGRRHGARRPPAPSTGPAWAGFRPLRVTKVVPESATVSSIYLTAAGRQPAPGGPGRAVPDAAGHRRRPARPGAQLLAVLRARRRHLPDQRQARAARRRQRLPEPARCGRARPSTWPRRAATSSSTTAPARCCSSRPASASRRCCPCCTSSRPRRSEREVWWIHGARGPQEHPLAAEAHALLASLPHAHEHVFYSAATAERRRGTQPGATKDSLAGWPSRPTRAPTSAGRPRS